MKTYVSLTPDQLDDLLRRFTWRRRVTGVQVHGTPSLPQAEFRGAETLEGLRRIHLARGLPDLSWHLVIGPEGEVWPARHFNLPPNSVAGHDGNAEEGPVAIALVGAFADGADAVTDVQRETLAGVAGALLRHFELAGESLRAHRELEKDAACLDGLDMDEVRRRADGGKAEGPAAARDPERWAGPEYEAAREAPDAIMARWAGAEPWTAHPPVPESDLVPDALALEAGRRGATMRAPGSADRRGGDGPALTPEQLDALRPHLVNLNGGVFSDEGDFRTTPADVDAIFEDHLERAHADAKKAGRPLRLMIWAHGGLVDERGGLGIAHNHVGWWRRNGVYPIHFVWESGLQWALGKVLSDVFGGRSRAARDVFDKTTDPLIERALRAIQGGKVWPAMKESAKRASEDGGGGAYVAERLAKLCKKHRDIEVHAAGHSAGAIFHAHFVPRALQQGVPSLTTLHLLAPAIRVDEFKRRLVQLVGKRGGELAMFTMKRDWEEDDDCAGVYQKSLLYLIHHALEPARRAPILGLEESLRADPEMKKLFGLAGGSARAEVVFSKSVADTGRSTSRATTHGGFDNDPYTMESVARRVLGRNDVVPFPGRRGLLAWADPGWPPEVLQLQAALGATPAPPSAPSPAPVAPHPPRVVPGAAPGAGRRRALCVGIDQYRSQPLSGCVADARQWARTLGGLGFETELLTDEAATRDGILDALGRHLGAAVAGDVVVFQYAGHGTFLDDATGDELDDPYDEALCPFDMDSGAYIIDDDLGALFTSLPEGVSLTCFFDCCHSGTGTRVAVGGPPPGGGPGSRRRFLPPTAEMNAAHRAFRTSRGLPPGSARRTRDGRDDMRDVLFAACQDNEVAWEDAGHGAFTTHATRVLGGGIADVSNDELQRRIVADFGADDRQHPRLDCRSGAEGLPVLGAAGEVAASRGVRRDGAGAGERREEVVAALLSTALDVLEGDAGA